MTESETRPSDIERYDKAMRRSGLSEAEFAWRPPYEDPMRLAGFPWFSGDRLYRRLPRDPDEPFREAVDKLADCPAGGQVHFRTDATRLGIRVQLADKPNMNHMPATGQCGFDGYLGEPGHLAYLGTARPSLDMDSYVGLFFRDAAREMRNVVLNFPLYMGVESVEIGTDPDARILAPPAFEATERIIVYGTSITQGGCACRPGMAYTNILARLLNREIVNLGFSGNGKGDPEVARTIAAISDPGLFVLDYEANAGGQAGLEETLEPFIRILRDARPKVPILLVSVIRRGPTAHFADMESTRAESAAWQKALVERLREAGDTNIHFFDGSRLFGEGDFGECTVDGTHPNDLGFYRMAHALQPEIRRILSGETV